MSLVLQNCETLNHVLELPHIARPVVSLEGCNRGPCQLQEWPSGPDTTFLEKGHREVADFLPPFAKRRYVDFDYLKTIVKILSEQSLGDALGQQAVRCCYHARGRGQLLVPAHL